MVGKLPHFEGKKVTDLLSLTKTLFTADSSLYHFNILTNFPCEVYILGKKCQKYGDISTHV
jgi:hypothetical protein